jgi:hypothetical protein
MTHKRRLAVLIMGGLVLAGVAGYIARADLRAWAFNQTGEESLLGQVRGVGQLALNLTHPPLQLAPYAPVNHAGVNPFGINTFLHNEVEPAKREEQVRLIAEGGFHWLREEFPWEDIEIEGRGDFIDRRNDPAGVDAWAKYDHIVGLAEEYGLEMIVRLSNPPSWSRSQPDEVIGAFAPPDDYGDFARFAAIVAERYRGRIRYYQLWNEPNIYPEWGEQIVSPEDYTDLLCQAYRAVKAVDPDIVVISGALAPTAELSGRDFNDYLFLQRMYDAGAGECFDILAMQGYGLWSGPTDRRMRPIVVNYARNEFIRDIMVRNGDAHKAIWISEMNWNAVPLEVADARFGRVTLDQQARYAPMAYQRAQEEWPWIGVISFWYFKRADTTWLDQQRPEAYFQMADPDFNLMPVYDAMQAYTARPPVLYSGTHWADHWGIAYGEGWHPWQHRTDRARQAESGSAGTVSFTFYGTSLAIVPGSDVSAGSGFTAVVDGGPPVTFAPLHEQQVIWRGRKGVHTVEIQPAGRLVIAQFVVRDDPHTAPAALAAGGLLMAGVGFAAWRGRRLAAQGAAGPS